MADSSVDGFMDDAHSQLEILHRQVFALANQSRARSAVPWKSVQRCRMQKAIITEMEGETGLSRIDIDTTGRHVKALTGRHPGTNRRQVADLIHRLRDADAIGVYARRQGLRIVTEIDDQIGELIEKIEKRMLAVESDDRMPRSNASKRRAHFLAVLDDRLDKSRRWNNELRTQNATLRQDIEDLNLERRTDLAILARLGESITEQRAGIRWLLDGMRQAELAQATALAEIAVLEGQHRAEMQKFEGDWARTAELDERHRALEQEIIRMKGEMYFGEGAKLTPDESIQLIMSRTAWRIAKDKALLAAASARHTQLRSLIDQLQRLTGTATIDQVVGRFERADADHLAQYAALQALIVELAQLERQPAPSPDPGAVVIVPAAGRIEPGRVQELDEEAAALRDVFAAMTTPIVSMMEALRSAGSSRCSEASWIGLGMVGVTAQNVESMVSALEEDLRLLFARLHLEDRQAPAWAPGDGDDDGLCIAVPSSLHYDDDLDIR